MSGVAKNRKRKNNIYEKYRRMLKRPDLTKREIDEKRKHLGLFAQTICEYVWGKKFYWIRKDFRPRLVLFVLALIPL